MGLLREAVDSVLYAVSSDTHRQVLTGVLFIYNGQTLTLVATDTHRLAVRKIEQAGASSDRGLGAPDALEITARAITSQDELEDRLRDELVEGAPEGEPRAERLGPRRISSGG